MSDGPNHPIDMFTAVDRVAIIRRPPKGQLIRRKSDGAFFEASHPGFPDMSGLFGGPKWFFRRIEQLPNKWWRGERWRRTGEIWRVRESTGWEQIHD